MNIKIKTYSAVRWTTLASIFRAGLQITQIAILTRILSAEDYGLMAIITAVLSFGVLFSDFGLSSALIQRKKVNDDERSSLYWLNVTLSTIITLFIIAISPLLSHFFKDQRLTPLIILSSSTFLLNAIGQQLKINSEKNLNFRPVIVIEIASSLLGFIAALVFALAEYGAYSLVISGITTSTIGSLLAWIYLRDNWKLKLRFRLNDISPYFKFGSFSLISNLINHFCMNIDILIGGRLFNSAQLGLYSVPRNLALQVQMIVNPVITRVAFPMIASLQTEMNHVKDIYLKTINMTASTNAPLYTSIALFSNDIIRLLLGNNWQPSSTILSIFALWGAIRSTGNPIGSLLLGLGRADITLKWNISFMIILPLFLLFGSQYGPLGMAWALVALVIVQFFFGWILIIKPLCKICFIEYANSALKPFAIAIISFIPTFIFSNLFDNIFTRLFTPIMLGIMLYMFVSYKFNKEWVFALIELTNSSKLKSFLK